MITRLMKIFREKSASASETRALGARLAKIAAPGAVYSIDGELGVGKTEFVRGFVEAVAADADVRSPTFSIVNTYQTPKFPIYHFDFYRMENQKELDAIGFDEYINGDGVCLIEWGMMFCDRIPDFARCVRLSDAGNGVRLVEAHFLF